MKIDWALYVFIAKGLTKVTEQKLDGGEKIILKYVTLEELISIVSEGRFDEKEVTLAILMALTSETKKRELKDLFRPRNNRPLSK